MENTEKSLSGKYDIVFTKVFEGYTFLGVTQFDEGSDSVSLLVKSMIFPLYRELTFHTKSGRIIASMYKLTKTSLVDQRGSKGEYISELNGFFWIEKNKTEVNDIRQLQILSCAYSATAHTVVVSTSSCAIAILIQKTKQCTFYGTY